MTIVASGGLVVTGATQASADSPGCVTRAEYERVHDGMRKARVHRIFDTRGRFGDGGAGGYSRLYTECHPRGGDGCTNIEYSTYSPAHPKRYTARVASKSWNGWCG